MFFLLFHPHHDSADPLASKFSGSPGLSPFSQSPPQFYQLDKYNTNHPSTPLLKYLPSVSLVPVTSVTNRHRSHPGVH